MARILFEFFLEEEEQISDYAYSSIGRIKISGVHGYKFQVYRGLTTFIPKKIITAKEVESEMIDEDASWQGAVEELIAKDSEFSKTVSGKGEAEEEREYESVVKDNQ